MRRWLAALETRLLDRHAAAVARANPWPRAGAVTTKGATMNTPPPNEGWNAPGTCGGGYWRVVNGIYEMWPPNPTYTATLGTGLTMTSKPLRSDSQPLAANSGTPEQPPTNESPHLAAKYWRERQEAVNEIRRLTRVIQIVRDTSDRDRGVLIAQRDDALGIYDAEVTRLNECLDEKDATIARMRTGRP